MIQQTGEYEDYVTTWVTDEIDTDKLRESCMTLYDYIIKAFPDKPGQDYDGRSTMTTKLYQRYNLLMYPCDQITELYRFLCESFRLVNGENDEPYWIQCWLNVYQRGDFIDWHTHWPPEDESWHGYYGVDVNDSVTTYKVPLPDGKHKQVDVQNKTGQVIISPSNDDQHRTWPWDKDTPRITIAFDILPQWVLLQQAPWINSNTPTGEAIYTNHWLPVI